ncbi:MAG TPA: AsmA family protein [Casimicrobiaceae bacterium]|nr:AsmA family protein [Casimicrobiaceae bacterium]
MTLFWRLLAIVGGVILLLLIAVAIAISTVDPKTFVGPIQSYIKDVTGRELTIRGGIDLRLSLEPKVVVEDVALSNAPWGKAPQMISAKRVEAQLALLPLLRRDFEVRSFELVEPTIALETDSKGTGNWEFHGPATGASAHAPAAAAPLGGLFVGDLAITNGSLSYRDGESGKVTNVTIETLSVNARDPQSAVSTRFRGTVDDIAVAIEGDLGPLTLLAQRRWPYPVSLKGQVNGHDAGVVTKLRAEDSTVSLDPLEVATGKSKLAGRMQVTTGKPRPKLTFNFTAPAVALTDLPLAAGPQALAAKATPKSRYVFTEEPLSFAGLKAVDATGEIALDALVLRDGQRLEHARAQLGLQNGILEAPVIQASAFGGTIAARLRVDANRETDPALTLKVDAKNLDLAAVLGAFDIKREVRGGKTSVTADIAAHGASPRRLASSASGSFTAIVGPASLGRPKGDADSAFNRLADAINPFRNVDASTELQCAVIRLPLRDGIASVDRSIAIETNKLAASASGTLDFRTETLDLSIKPQVRQGISINIAEIAQLVRLHGPFTSPGVTIDAVATAATVARIGAAVSTSGASLLGEMLLSHGGSDSGAPCQVALGRAAPGAASAGQAPAKPSAPADDVSKALNRLLGR